MNLPPYGSPPKQISMPVPYKRMEDWSGSDSEWRAFYDTMVSDIKTHIWPVWNTSTLSWDGDAAQFAQAATKAENALCIQHIQKANVLQQLPHTPQYQGPHAPKSHYWHYSVEDAIGSFGAGSKFEIKVQSFPIRNVVYYDDQIVPEDMDQFFPKMFRRKYEGIYRTKLEFRRPRPQQTAFIFGQEDFVWQQARSNVHTGNHPALISGHCAQGLLLMCTLVDELLQTGTPASDIRLDAYAQYAVDFGDRRVFAGVHYPTDNLSSWVMVLRLIPWVFPKHGDFLQSFIREAIMTKSTVYKLMDQHFGDHPELSEPLAFLRANVTELTA